MTHEEVRAYAFDYIRQELAPEQRQAVEEHLQVCEACRAYVEEVRALEHLLAEAPGSIHLLPCVRISSSKPFMHQDGVG